MATDDKESDERRRSRSLERDRGKRRRRHRSASPSSAEQRLKRSRSPGAVEKHRHKNSAQKHEASGGHEVSNRNAESMSEEDNGREVARKNGMEVDEKAGARNSSKEDRKVELRLSGDSSEDADADSESDRRRKKKNSRSKNHQGRKSKSKHRRHVRLASEEDESQTEGTSKESSQDSEDESRRTKRQKRLKEKEKIERERMEERRRKKEKVELRSRGYSSKDADVDGESDRGWKRKKSRSKNHQSRKSKSKHRQHVRLESEEDESQTEGTSGESSEDSEDESRRAKRRKRLKPKEKAERERKEERRQKEKKRKMEEKERDQEKRNKKKEKVNLETSSNPEDEDMLKESREVKREGLRKGMLDQVESREDLQYDSRLEITEVCNEEKESDVGDCLEGDHTHCKEASNDDPVLDPKHKIFLSHSGVQKEFVEHLCEALEFRFHYPFFDSRSLPKGKRFAKLILEAIKQCEMLIVVVSDEYFMSKWPMIELSAFVKAHKLHLESKSSSNGPKILPLFYGLSVHDFKDASKRKKWIQKWRTWAKKDPKRRIKVSEWKHALDVLGEFNGIEYDTNLKEVVAYIDKIVSHVCKSISPDMKWDDSHVQGKSRICKVLREKIEGVDVSQKFNVKVIGIYGVGGIGKTTICMTLCNELSSEYEGRVCHVVFESVPGFKQEECFQKVLRDSMKKSMEVIKQWNEGQCIHALHKNLPKHKVLLVVDNVSFHNQSIEHANKFLDFPYHKESLVIVTARSKSHLESMGIDGDACVEMPELEKVEAMKLFLHYAAQGKEFTRDEDKACILKCIQSCYFSKGDGLGYHYHPLALRILGSHSNYHGRNPLEWEKNLPKVRSFGSIPGKNEVYGFLKNLFDTLSFDEQRLFMDVGLCKLRSQAGFLFELGKDYFETSIIQWLYNLHEGKEDEVQLQLENLKHRGLLDLEFKEIGMHDLHLEFVELEAKGSFNDTGDLRMQKWLYIDNGDLTKLEKTPEGRCWPDLVHLNVVQPDLFLEELCQIATRIAKLKRIQWDHFSNVEVLHLQGLHWGGGAFNLEPLRCLRALHLSDNVELCSLEGLETLGNLTGFTWEFDADGLGRRIVGWRTHIVGSLPLSLKILFMSGGNVVFGPDFLAKCHNLSELGLGSLEVNMLDLSNCGSLETVKLYAISKLQILSGLSVSRPSSLQSISIYDCEDLVDISGVDHLPGLEELGIYRCSKLKLPGVLAPTEFLDLESRLGRRSVESVVVGAQNSFRCQLRTLSWTYSPLLNGLNLDGLNKLEDLDLRGSDRLVSLEGVGDLHALQILDLAGCNQLLRLPDLSNLKDLKYLILDGCNQLLRLPDLSNSENLENLNLSTCYALKLHEEDIQMLSKLPSLEPVPFSKEGGGKSSCVLRLDFHQRKVRIPLCERGQWSSYCTIGSGHKDEERDLGAPPLQIAKYGPK